MRRVLRSYVDVIQRIRLRRESKEDLGLWSYHPVRPEGFTPFGVGEDELLFAHSEAEKIPEYVRSYFEPKGEPREEVARVVVLSNEKGVAFIPLPCPIEKAREIVLAWRNGTRLTEYEITIRVLKDDVVDHPVEWDWASLLDIPFVEVLRCEKKR